VPAHHPSDDPLDEGPLADLTSGGMWIAAGLVGLAALLLPGSDRDHAVYAIAMAAFAIGWGGVSLHLWRRGHTMSIGLRAVVTACTLPLVALALWATGGADTFLAPLMLFTALFIAYFFPPRLAWPLTGLFAATYASPLLYDGAAFEDGFPGRVLVFAVSVAGMNVAIQGLKRRLLRAEARQRTMASRDPLTGLHNRRSFDAHLANAARSGGALVLFDFDAFKAINDELGHPAGDAVLRAVADACRAVVREGDCLARIGGDEFAVIAPGAGSGGVARMVASLEDAISGAAVPIGVGHVRASFAWALAPADAQDAAGLLDRADRRLLDRKRLNKSAI
jgi:diguanylate cyclase (GGDEF)-like protein